MAERYDRNGLEILDRAECLRLLGGATLGRIALTIGALPMILPVNFFIDGEHILIRSGRGSKLFAAASDAVVAFEVDHADNFTHTGWSVSVTGRAREVTDPDDLKRVLRLPLPHWASNADGDAVGHVIAISTDLLSGRRIPEDHRFHVSGRSP